MGKKQFLSSAICVALMGGLLATCDWPQAAPTPTPPISSPTSVLSTAEPPPTTGPEIISHDFSDFTHFSYGQRAGSCGGLWPSLGTFEADISRLPSGDYLLKASIAEMGTPGVDQCIYLTSSECITIIQLPERTLTPIEADAVLDTFRDIEILLSDPWEVWCECTLQGHYFQWDLYAFYEKDCTDYPRLVWGTWQYTKGGAGKEAVMSLLDQLVTRSVDSLSTATPR